MGRSRTSKYYKKRMPEKDEKLREAITSILGTSRLGRKKVIVKVRKKYPGYGSSQIRRVYQKYGFSLYKRMKRKRFDNPANPIAVPLERNEEWAMDFMSDALAGGSRFRTLNIIDQYNRKCLGIDIRTSMPSRAVITFLERVIEKHGKPRASAPITVRSSPRICSRSGCMRMISNGSKSRKENHSRMPLSSGSTKPIGKTFWTHIYFFHSSR